MTHAPPYTPETLALRWDCSAETVRQMVRDGRLPAFRVGRMMRIAAKAVEDFECRTIESGASMAATSSSGTMMPAFATVIALRHTRPKKPSEKRAT
jgi:excisionase family DNA binding protein